MDTQGDVGDNGLGAEKFSGPEWSSAEKKLHRLAKNMGIKFTIEYGMKKTDFLDVMFDLTRGNRKPYMKPNNEIKYVNVGSNHPKCIIEQLPKMISNRLSKISSGEIEFNEEKPAYEEALKKSGI